MSYTSDYTFTSSERDTSDNIEDFSSLGESAGDWDCNTPKSHNADTSNQQRLSDSCGDVNEPLNDLLNAFNDDSFTSSAIAGLGAWSRSDQVSGPSTEGSGYMNQPNMQYQFDDALGNDNIHNTRYFEAHEHDVWETNSADTNVSPQSMRSPASTTGSGTSAGVPGKERLPPCETDLSNQRAKLRSILFTCEWCQKTFTRRTDLTRHMNNIHQQGPVTVCDICSHQSRRKDKVMEHCQRVHKQKQGKETVSEVKSAVVE